MPQPPRRNGRPRVFVPFSYQVPAPQSLGSIELRGPGISIVHHAGRVPPSVRIDQARVVGSQLSLHWNIQADPATTPLSTVLVSDDRGATYDALLTEQQKTSLIVPIGRGKHRVRIVVTDGTRSAETFTDVSLP